MRQRYCIHCQAPIGQKANYCGKCAGPNPPRILTRSIWIAPIFVLGVAAGCFMLTGQPDATPVKVAIAPLPTAQTIYAPTDAPVSAQPATVSWGHPVYVNRKPASRAGRRSRKDATRSVLQAPQMSYEQAQNGGCGSDENIHTPRDYANMLKCELQAAKTVDDLVNYKARWLIFERDFQSELDTTPTDEQASRIQTTKLRILHDITWSMRMAAEAKIQNRPDAFATYQNHAYAEVAIWELGNPKN